MNPEIKKLRSRESELSEKLELIRKAIKSLQNVCEHKFEEVGQDSHHTLEQCVHCETQREI